MSIIGSIRAEYTQKALDSCIKELEDLDKRTRDREYNWLFDVKKIVHKHFDSLCLE